MRAECRTYELDLPDREAVKIWIIDNQKGRRNLTDGWKYELAQVRKQLLAEKGRENLRLSEGRGVKKPLSDSDKPLSAHNTRSEIAKDLGWSTGKVAQAEFIEETEKIKADSRMKAGKKTDPVETLPQGDTGKTRDKVAKARHPTRTRAESGFIDSSK